ncbi:MAG: 2-phospho-L-lactate guanylyltransferase [Acidimicrobiia bacterium]|nr:2-phospho-L-lactate guanylyltransferase [Acidimicrobiia bacterium]
MPDARSNWRARAGVVVPIRSFVTAKARLAEHLPESRRADFARELATRVVEAAAPLPVIVVTAAPEVREWAKGRGLDVVDDPGHGLDGAADAGRARAVGLGCVRTIVAHGDLPYAEELAPLGRDLARPIVVLVPCHRDDGTNVCSVPADVPFQFAYGPGSFRRHAVEARRLGLGLRVVRRADLAFDVDIPADLDRLNMPAAT